MSEPVTVAFVALGCVKNLVDSEKMLGQLAEAGCILTDDESQADVIVVNTCGFLQAARQEALEVISEVVAQKQAGCCKRVVVAGCLVQRDGEELLKTIDGIDALVGVHNRDSVVDAVLERKTEHSAPSLYLSDYHPHVFLDTARLRLTPRHYAYLRISEGCNQKCTFCTIPAIRGPMHCKPPEVILAEARELIADGVVELNLIGQDTTSYGADVGYEPGLAGLLRELNRLDGVRWIRLMYAYPSVFTEDMIEAIADCEKVVNYVDIPLQHINDRILRAMHRQVTRAQTEKLLDRLRDRIPEVTIRTTLIAGFPGETDEEFQELIDFVRTFRFDALGVFAYSLEPDTPSGRMKGQLPQQVREERVDALMRVQQEVAFGLAADKVGQRFEVLIEGEADGYRPARHAGQAPEVDSVTLVSDTRAEAGRFVQVECVGTEGYDLIAKPTNVTLMV